MKTTGLACLLAFLFLGIQGGLFVLHGLCPGGKWMKKGSSLHPLRVSQDETITPLRVIVLTRPGKRIPTGFDREMSPTVAWVFGRPMNWEKVTKENLRWIPGVSRRTAERLIRLRDVYAVKDFDRLGAFPRIGATTIQRLKRFCFTPHAD